MNSFTLTQAASAEEAVRDLSYHDGAAYLGGGTSLVDLMKCNVARPPHLTSLRLLPLHQLTDLPGGGLHIGATATNSAVAYHEQVQARYPLLSQAILAGASPQLRNMATIGGNLNQRTRCLYFHDLAAPCNKREPGTGCPALTGYNRPCGVLGTSGQCIATHPSDMCVALAALEAVVHVQGPDGERTIPFGDFHCLPGDYPERDNTLQTGELVTAIELPAEGYAEHFAYLKLRDRSSHAFALVSVAVALEMSGDTIRRARFALGGVAHKPWRDQAAEQLLEGQAASADLFRQVTDKVFAEAQGYGANTFKIALGKRALQRTLWQAIEMDYPFSRNAFQNASPLSTSL
jgi:xanthine dehydrogenase YagS FAD-binding subunit